MKDYILYFYFKIQRRLNRYGRINDFVKLNKFLYYDEQYNLYKAKLLKY